MLLDVVGELAIAFAELGIRWVVVGAVAANVYRRQTRLTGDVDVLLAESTVATARIESMFSSFGIEIDLSDIKPGMSDEAMAAKAAEVAAQWMLRIFASATNYGRKDK